MSEEKRVTVRLHTTVFDKIMQDPELKVYKVRVVQPPTSFSERLRKLINDYYIYRKIEQQEMSDIHPVKLSDNNRHWISLKEVHDYEYNDKMEKVKMSLFTGYVTTEQMQEICKIVGVRDD